MPDPTPNGGGTAVKLGRKDFQRPGGPLVSRLR